MALIEINPKRLEYLVELFGFTKESFIQEINSFYKKNIVQGDIFSQKIELNYLKKIDKEIFKKDLSFYTDPADIGNKQNRIFFRKDTFNSPLEIGDRKIISKLEDEISYLNGLNILAREKERKRKFKIYSKEDDPNEIAQEIRKSLHPNIRIKGDRVRIKGDRAFLKALISNFADYNIFVFEFVEQWNKKEKSNFNGCFITPNNIIIKRQQEYFKREIFTLAHELGHYLLESEELDKIDFSTQRNLSKVERWCNQFAFAFLLDINDQTISEKIEKFISNRDLSKLNFLENHHISRLAFLTHLFDKKKIIWEQYDKFKKQIEKQYNQNRDEQNRRKVLNKEKGIKSNGMSALEIISPLKDHIYKSAYFEGVIGEVELRKKLKLKIRKKNFEDFLYE